MTKYNFCLRILGWVVGLNMYMATLYAENVEGFVYRAQNPLSPTFSVPLYYTYHGGADNGSVSVGRLAPIMPVALGEDWRLINQLSLNFLGTDGGITGIEELPQPYSNDGAAGLADLRFTSYFTSANPGRFIWGIGPAFVFPTDHPSRDLGSGKFSIGPALMFVTQPKPWSLGLKIKQVWSVFGSVGRDDVSQMVLQPFVNYNLANGWYLVSDMDMIANWNAAENQQWTVPVGGGVGKLFALDDSYAINTRLEGYYNPVRPDNAPDWSINFSVQFLFAD